MSDRFTPLEFQRLARWVLDETDPDRIMGLPRALVFQPRLDDPFRMMRYGQVLETPIGVAAGPQTQLAQNIIVSWLMGARYIELKTVQTLDELEVTKPCIEMNDEGYNCEWSQELKLAESFDEYLNAWVLIHVLRHRFGWQSNSEGPGFIFNLSLGYDLAGMQNPNMQEFLRLAADCSVQIQQKAAQLGDIYPEIAAVTIPSRLSDNVTVSTMHGCPPHEIEQIGTYLMVEHGLHTAIKLNPTLLGVERLRPILNAGLGFEVEVPDEAFEHDLKFAEAVTMIESLLECGRESGVEFGLKLTNTLEVRNKTAQLPANEAMVYLSGRALHPISVQVAAKLQAHFEGALDLSFCAGVDCFNVADLVACGLAPVTTCSDLLKPGGYTRLPQYLDEIRSRFAAAGARSVADFISAAADKKGDVDAAAYFNLQAYANAAPDAEQYKKSSRPYGDIKTGRELTAYDCITAPCMETCAVTQDVPSYMYYAALGDMDAALAATVADNPMPHTTGMICDHLCESKCTRINYDQPLRIREIKRYIAEHAALDQSVARTAGQTQQRAAIIGAGPSGLACAYFLARAGVPVDVFESQAQAGGMPAGVIPAFRLDPSAVQAEVDFIAGLGVSLHYSHRIDRREFDNIAATFDWVYLAAGAPAAKSLNIPGEDGAGVLDQLQFLRGVHAGNAARVGAHVVVIGGGDSAMDAARAARRLAGADGRVTVLYRRTRNEMPAAADEITALAEEDILLQELTAPVKINLVGNRVTSITCCRMELGAPDASGRPRPVPVAESEFDIPVSTVIRAIGQDVVLDFLPDGRLEVDPDTGATNMPNVYAGGDVWRGANTLINAIGDGKRAAQHIVERIGLAHEPSVRKPARDLVQLDYELLQARRQYGPVLPAAESDMHKNFDLVHQTLSTADAVEDAARCLYCDDFCNICVTVCPNLANVGYTIDPRNIEIPAIRRSADGFETGALEIFKFEQKYQIINIADFCNECGNCVTFCPTSGAPFQTKPQFYLTEEEFTGEPDGYFLRGGTLRARVAGKGASLRRENGRMVYETTELLATFDEPRFLLVDIQYKSKIQGWTSLEHAAQMYVLFKALQGHILFI